jgi:hypothetical protein
MSTKVQNLFYGGMAQGQRDPSLFKFDYSKHFDIFSDPHRLIPFRSVYADNTGLSTDNRIVAFFMYNVNVYALGRKSNADPKIKFYNNTLGGDGWAASSGGEAASATGANPISPTEYRGKAYGWRANGQIIFSYDPVGASFTETAKDTGATATIYTSGIEGKSDGCLYMPQGNILWKFDGTTWTQALLTIPTDEAIVGVENYGNYLAVLTNKTAVTTANALVYLWDFSSPFASEIFELASPFYRNLGISEGALCVVGTEVDMAGTSLVVSIYIGGGFSEIFRKVVPASIVSYITRKENGKMYFAMNDSDSLTHQKYQGIWVVGKSSLNAPFAVTIAYDWVEPGGAEGVINNFFVARGQVYIVSTDYLVHKIAYSGSYGSTISSVEFCKINEFAKLDAAYLDFNPMPGSGVLKLKVLPDDDDQYTEIFSAEDNDDVTYETDTTEIHAETVTMTIAAPAVISAVNHGFGPNQPIVFTTTGALPTGLVVGTTYYVSTTDLKLDSFKVAASPDGTPITTTGSQSGTHTATSLTHELPTYDMIGFRVESTGGVDVHEFAFRTTEQNSLYG